VDEQRAIWQRSLDRLETRLNKSSKRHSFIKKHLYNIDVSDNELQERFDNLEQLNFNLKQNNHNLKKNLCDKREEVVNRRKISTK